jgi:hypothetical protein
MLNVIKSLYSSVSLCISSQCFDIDLGLRQGFILSPVLFNCYINDLAVNINSLGLGLELVRSGILE